jgi:hypothetical protein
VRNSVTVGISIDIAGAVAGKVGTGPTRGLVLWRRRDEGECHIFRTAVTVSCERIAAILTLHEVSQSSDSSLHNSIYLKELLTQ